MAYSRSFRLITKQDFQAVFDQPVKVTHQYLQALFRRNQRSHARLGIIIAKHRVRLAVDRNRLRRVIRESFRQHKDPLMGLDIVVLMRSPWQQQDKKQIRTDIDYLWQIILKRLIG